MLNDLINHGSLLVVVCVISLHPGQLFIPLKSSVDQQSSTKQHSFSLITACCSEEDSRGQEWQKKRNTEGDKKRRDNKKLVKSEKERG